jgi:hypothetical protein
MKGRKILDQLTSRRGSKVPTTVQQLEQSLCLRRIGRCGQCSPASVLQRGQRQILAPALHKRLDGPRRHSGSFVVVMTSGGRSQRLESNCFDPMIVDPSRDGCERLCSVPRLAHLTRNLESCFRIEPGQPKRAVT